MGFGGLYLILYFPLYQGKMKHTPENVGKYIFSLADSKNQTFEKSKAAMAGVAQ